MKKTSEATEKPAAAATNQMKNGASVSASPFALAEMFVDPQGLLDAKYKTLDEIKDDCLVTLDANVMLLPYAMGSVTLAKVVVVYKRLADEGRLIVPAQSAREFGKHRSKKIAEIVKHLQDQASAITAPLQNQAGFLADDPGFLEVKKLASDIGAIGKEIQKKVKVIVERISTNVGGDPVSDSYREVFAKCVRDTDEPTDPDGFQKELKQRYANQIPPGYKDESKLDQGVGDLIIWYTILRAGAEGSRNSIFVTADNKSDWYTQSGGAFQPRLELLEEYRVKTGGGTIHIVPLSRLLELYDADELAVANTRAAETTVTIPQEDTDDDWVDDERAVYALRQELAAIQNGIKVNQDRLIEVGDDFNTSLSLPWNRANLDIRRKIESLHRRRNEVQVLMSEIDAKRANRGGTFRYNSAD